jgi:hypothetical protein
VFYSFFKGVVAKPPEINLSNDTFCNASSLSQNYSLGSCNVAQNDDSDWSEDDGEFIGALINRNKIANSIQANTSEPNNKLVSPSRGKSNC